MVHFRRRSSSHSTPRSLSSSTSSSSIDYTDANVMEHMLQNMTKVFLFSCAVFYIVVIIMFVVTRRKYNKVKRHSGLVYTKKLTAVINNCSRVKNNGDENATVGICTMQWRYNNHVYEDPMYYGTDSHATIYINPKLPQQYTLSDRDYLKATLISKTKKDHDLWIAFLIVMSLILPIVFAMYFS